MPAPNDPLAGWGQANLAAPNRPQGQVQHRPSTVYTGYDDEDPSRGQDPAPAQPQNHAPSTQRSVRFQNPSPGAAGGPAFSDHPAPRGDGHQRAKRGKELTQEQIAKCSGDTHWPPPNEVHVKPLHYLYQEGGQRKAVYYNLIWGNTADEAEDWKASIMEQAQKGASQIPSDQMPQITIIQALNSKKLTVLGEGKRGKIWLLDEGNAGVWSRVASMQAERGAVRVLTGHEEFQVFGAGLKGNKGNILLVSWPAEEETKL